MAPLNVHIKSFGCQMNKLDTALVASALKDKGFTLTDDPKDADVVLINTCSVRKHAEDRVTSHLGHLKHLKETRPEIIVAVIGCMAQRQGAALLNHKAVDIVCGPAQIPQIPQLIEDALRTKTAKIAVTPHIREKSSQQQIDALENFESVYDTDDKQLPAQAFVRVMRGCNNFCSYCIVPYVRGPEISRSPGVIIDQIRTLAGNGIKQITLLGQTVNSYHYSAGDKNYCLADILEMASRINGIEWIRFITSYPAERFFEPICCAMARLPKVCRYLHLPAQSGSDRILKAMNRRYTASQYLNLLDKARSIVPGIAISSDFIVGFPSETEHDFRATAELVEKARLKNSFIFKYSPRPGTAATDLPDDVPMEIKKKRNTQLLDIQNEISDTDNKRFIGSAVRVLVEGPGKKPHLNAAENADLPQLIARTAEDYIVVFNGPADLAGSFCSVNIIKTSPLTLFGELAPR
ncbi:MAG: tRNA (N6-isopentenyl adenosine(37)-C2)-methylthiotransferase MiaB [Planctomycetota bacterium]